jgi:glycosyltransferase involved in cell wall biosynthesis
MSKSSKKHYPFVSVCTPTYNRRPFIPTAIKCFKNQTYPANRMEWIIIDDGTDKIEDLVKDIPEVKYFRYETKMTLGKKRNLMHQKCKGSIIVYMDDDDYYPPERVSHAVEMLEKNPNILCAGSSEMHIYFKHVKKMYQFGPYGPNHATAATFAFRKEYLSRAGYDNETSCAEEKHFLRDYNTPLVQLDTRKTILVVSHIHNSLDKKMLLDEPGPFVKESQYSVDDFIKEPEIKKFFIEDIEELLEVYEPGKPENKPDVMKQIAEIHRKREEMKAAHGKKQITIQELIQNYEKRAQDQNEIIQDLLKENRELKSKSEYLDKKIKELIDTQIALRRNRKTSQGSL